MEIHIQVVPFGPTNAPGFYSAMMRNMKEEWDNLFISRLKELLQIDNEAVVVSISMEVFIGGKKLVFGTKIIIDDILLWCSNVSALDKYRTFCLHLSFCDLQDLIWTGVGMTDKIRAILVK